MSCSPSKLDCKRCACKTKKTAFEKCCPKECRCISDEEYNELTKGFNEKNIVKNRDFIEKLAPAQYSSKKGTVKGSGKKCKLSISKCQKKSKCFMVPKSKDKSQCCNGQTGHHLIPGSLFASKDERKTGEKCYSTKNHDSAPTVCVAGGSHSVGTHGLMHLSTKKEFMAKDNPMDYETASDASLDAHQKVFKSSDCDKKCMKADLDKFYKDELGEEHKEANCTSPADRKDLSPSNYGYAGDASNLETVAHFNNLAESMKNILGSSVSL